MRNSFSYHVTRATDDDIFNARLPMDAARAAARPPQLWVFRHAIDEAFVVHDYVGYYDMHDHAADIHSVLYSLQNCSTTETGAYVP